MRPTFNFIRNMYPSYISIATGDTASAALEEDVLQNRQKYTTHVETLKKLLMFSTTSLTLMAIVVTMLLSKPISPECSHIKAAGFQNHVPESILALHSKINSIPLLIKSFSARNHYIFQGGTRIQ